MTPEEALRHAYAADIARLPPHLRGQYDADSMASNHASGTADPRLSRFRELVTQGHPNYVPQNDDDREIQEQMLSGYSGQPFTPSQQQALGRDPQPYEYSPGAKYLADAESRARLYDDMSAPVSREAKAAATAATPSRGMMGSFGFVPNFAPASKDEDVATARKQLAADNYGTANGRTHSVTGMMPVSPYDPGKGYANNADDLMKRINTEIQNPENSLGALTTQVTGAVSDGMSLLGTALLRNKPVTNVLGDAATRVAGANWNRSYPAITSDNGWRANNALIEEGRAARAASEGMTSADTWRAAVGNHIPHWLLPEKYNGQIPYIQPAINTGIGIVNGLLDGTGSIGSMKSVGSAVQGVAKGIAKAPIPGVKGLANSTYNSIAANMKANPTYMGRFVGYNVDEAADVTNGVEGVVEAMSPSDTRTNKEFDAEQVEEEQERVKAIKTLENLNGQIVPPKTTVSRIGGALAPAGGFLQGLLSK